MAIYGPKGESLTREQWLHCIDRYEEALGFQDQPRAVSFHIDEQSGEIHPHVAWSRINTENEKYFAIDPGLYILKGIEVAREVEIELGLARVGSERNPDHKTQSPKRDELEESRRLGTDLRQVRETIRDCLDRSDNGQSFKAAIEQEGMALALGDRRNCFVVIDQEGGLHALNKKLTGMTLAQTRERLGDTEHEQLPGIEQARAHQLDRRIATLEAERTTGREAERVAEAPNFDRDDAAREWEERLIAAAIAYEQNREHRADPAAAREFASADAQAERAAASREQQERPELGKTAGETRLSYTLSDTARGFVEALEERGLRLARVSAQDAAANEQMREGYQQLLKDHPELAGQPNIKEPPRLTEGDLVVVSLYKDEPKLCFLNECTTGDERGEIKKFLGTLNEHNLPDIKGAAHDLREAREREADGRAEPSLGQTAGEIRMVYTLSQNGREFADGLEERGMRLARVSLSDVLQNEYAREHAAEYGLRPPPDLKFDQLVIVNRYGSINFLNQRTTGDSREEIEKFLSTIERGAFQTVEEVHAEQKSAKDIPHDPELDGKYIFQLRALRDELKATRRDLREQLANEDLLPSQRVALEERQTEAGKRLMDVRWTINEVCAANPMVGRSEFAPVLSTEGHQMGESPVRGFANTVLSAGKELGDMVSGVADFAAKLFDFVVDFFITPSRPTPEMIYARQNANEAATEAAIVSQREDAHDDYNRGEQQRVQSEKDSQRDYYEQQRRERGLDRDERER